MRSLLVEESASAMDEALDQIGQTLLNLEQNTDFYKLLYWKHAPVQGSTDAYELYHAQKQMTRLLEYTQFNYDYAIYLPQADLVYSANSFVYGIQWFYEHIASYEGMDYDTFSQTVLNTEHNLDVIPSLQLVSRKNTSKERFYRQEDGILYLVSLPFSVGSSRSSQGVAAIHLYFRGRQGAQPDLRLFRRGIFRKRTRTDLAGGSQRPLYHQTERNQVPHHLYHLFLQRLAVYFRFSYQ